MTCDFCHNAQGEFSRDDTGVFLLELNMGGHPACAYRVQETLSMLRKEESEVTT